MARNRLLDEISDLVGRQGAIQLVRRYGGRTLSVPYPEGITESHPLTFTLGMANAKALAKHYGGNLLNLPSEVNALLDLRNEEIVRRFLGPAGTGEDGESIRSLSIDFGLDRKYIQKIVDKAGHRDLRLSRSMTDA